MIVTICHAKDIPAARKRQSSSENPATGPRKLPPVTSKIVDALFTAESDQRGDDRSFRRAA